MVKISKASPKHLDAIMQIFKNCTDAMLQAGIKQWDYTYPIKNIVAKNITVGEVFIAEQYNQCLGTVTLNTQEDEQYQNINWNIKGNAVLVIHRLAVDPSAQGLGIGKQLCLFAEDFGQRNHFDCIRLDAYVGNPISQKLYRSLGYQLAEGQCHFHNNELPFNCFEKEIPAFNR